MSSVGVPSRSNRLAFLVLLLTLILAGLEVWAIRSTLATFF